MAGRNDNQRIGYRRLVSPSLTPSLICCIFYSTNLMKAKLNNLIHDLIIGRDAPAGPFKNKQITDFFVRARKLMSTVPEAMFIIKEFNKDDVIIRYLYFFSTTLGLSILVTVHSQGDDHRFKTLSCNLI